jgi:hypothetical protein
MVRTRLDQLEERELLLSDHRHGCVGGGGGAARARNWQQTIRPNGEALEGNPRENYLHYRDELVARAMQHVRCSNDDSA